MAGTWTCPMCASSNDDYRFSCASCGTSRPASSGPDTGLPADHPSPGTYRAPVPTPPPVHSTGAPAPGGPEPAAAAGISPESAPPEVAARPLWRRIPPGAAIFAIVLVVGAAASWYFGASRSSTGEITRSGDLAASDLQVGDCFDLKDPSAEDVEDVSAKVCGEEHEFEVFLVEALPDGDYPGDDAFSAFVQEECLAAFETYIGRDYYESELDIFYFTPSPDAWASGDRTIQCAVYHPLQSRLTGSLKASNR